MAIETFTGKMELPVPIETKPALPKGVPSYGGHVHNVRTEQGMAQLEGREHADFQRRVFAAFSKVGDSQREELSQWVIKNSDVLQNKNALATPLESSVGEKSAE